jgi:hypothetical protein
MAVNEEIRKSMAYGGLAFGALGLLAPRAFASLYGVPDDAGVRTMTRLWGTRTAALCAVMLGTDRAEDQRKLMTLVTAMNALDVVAVATAGGLPARARVLGSLTSASFAAGGAYWLTSGQ